MSTSSRTLYEQLREEANQVGTTERTTTHSIMQWLILGTATLLITALLPGTGGEAQYAAYNHTLLGTTWVQESITAEYSFPVLKSTALLTAQRDSASAEAPVVFRKIPVIDATINARILEAKKVAGADAAAWFGRNAGQILQICNVPFIVGNHPQNSRSASAIILDEDGTAKMVDRSVVNSLSYIQEHVSALAFTAPEGLRTRIEAALEKIPTTTLVYDSVATQHEREMSRAGVSSTMDIVRKGNVIVTKGQRVDEATLARLFAYSNATFLRADIKYNVFAIIGGFGHAILIIGFVALFLYFLRPASFHNLGQLGTLASLPVLCAFMGWMSVRLDPVLPLQYVIIVPALAMIITILYEARTALLMTVAMSIAAGATRGDDYGTVVVLLIGGTMGVYSARNIHSRTQIFTSIVAIFFGLVIAVVAIDLERSAPIQWMWPKIVMASANAVISPLITFGIILVFERVFNVATDLRLEEFNNLNHELLRKLNERAPGTYQHTLAVARLSEAAAQAIGANQLLVRVGAYFHDVGKIEKSEYFVENQIDIENKHDRLPPRKSASIIRQHVQDGIELAASYRLPERISQFIPMHHGTILIKHFYAAALEGASTTENVQIDEKDFRYPGPKPNSKETGIVMLADAAEAVSRLVDTTQRDQIAAAVEKIIADRVTDNQLSETPLTMHDLQLIKEAFVRNILGTTHKRVQYKEVQPTNKPA